MTVDVEDLPDISFSFWCHVAKSRPTVILKNGKYGTMIGINRDAHVTRCRVDNKHYTVAYEDIWAMQIVDPKDASVSDWLMLPSWQLPEPEIDRVSVWVDPLPLQELPVRRCCASRREATQHLGKSFRLGF